MNPTNKPLAVNLDGKRYQLFFDLNTFEAFERQTGMFFLDFLANLGEAIQLTTKGHAAADPLEILRKISITNIRAFIWAALHTYTADGEPVWPFTIGQMSRLIDINTMANLVPSIMTANAENMQSPDEKGGSNDANVHPTDPGLSSPGAGGLESGLSDADVLASLTKKSAN